MARKTSLSRYCKEIILEVQAASVLISLGIIVHEKVATKTSPRILVSVEDTVLLEGTHYVTCVVCHKKMLSISNNHCRVCTGQPFSDFLISHPNQVVHSEVATERRKFSEDRKKAISSKLVARFQTPEGEATRATIARASKAYNAKTGVRELKSAIMQKRMDAPGAREKTSAEARARWATNGHREKIADYQAKNANKIAEMASHARLSLSKTSNLHKNFKSVLPSGVRDMLTTELPESFYSIDEGNRDLRIAIEIDGCYWHGCENCGYPGVGSIKRIDKSKESYLRNRGWSILRIKECDIKADLEDCINKVSLFVEESKWSQQKQEG